VGLQSHHAIQKAWAEVNIPGYKENLAPSVTLETGRGYAHTIITSRQGTRAAARLKAGKGKWSSTIDEELSNLVSDFRAAKFRDSTIKRVLTEQYKMLDKLRVKYQRPKGF
jgi:hypothetical protein